MWEKKLLLEERKKHLQPQRQNDSHIMEEFIRNVWSIHDLAEINRCRQYLHAKCLVYIATGDGAIISKKTWTGEKSKP